MATVIDMAKHMFDVFAKHYTDGWQMLKTKRKLPEERKIMQIVLKYFGMLRVDLVKELFDTCRASKDPMGTTRMHAFGSTNIESDYDATITGKNAPDVVECMIETFYERNKTMMSFMFDTNLYCVGLLDTTGIRQDLIEQGRVLVPYPGIAIVYPKRPAEFATCLAFATMKLWDLIRVDDPLRQLIQKHTSAFSSLCTSQQAVQKTRRSYQLQVEYARKTNAILYGNGQDDNMLVEYACTSMFFAIESYYTPMTVLVVVLFLQGKKIKKQDVSSRIPEFCFLCSVLENLGDFYQHTPAQLHQKTDADLIPYLIQVSKYIYRVLISIYYLTRDSSFQVRAQRVQKQLVSLRGSDKSGIAINLDSIRYQPGETLHVFVNRFCSEIMVVIAPYISRFLTMKQQARRQQ